MFYTYIHTRNDTGAVFYVGKGHGKRAFETRRPNPHWRRIVAKYGHTVEILESFADENDAFAHERYLIASLRACGTHLCNMTDGGEGASGAQLSAKTRARMSAAQKGRVPSAYQRARASEVHKGKLVSDHTRALIGVASRGRKASDITLTKMRDRMIGNKYGLGTTQSEETKSRRAASLKGHPVSDYVRSCVSASKLGKSLSAEHRAKLSVSHKGYAMPEAQKLKIAESVRSTLRKRRQEAAEPSLSGMLSIQ